MTTSLPVLAPRSSNWPAVRAILLRIYRAAAIAIIAWMIFKHYQRIRLDGDAPIRVDEAKKFFPTAARLKLDDTDKQLLMADDADGRRLGYVLRTSPHADHIKGYAGPTDTLVALDNDLRVVGIAVRSSWDTKTHLRDVVIDDYFMKLWNGKTWDEVAKIPPRQRGIEGVAGSSLTSIAIAESIHARFKHVKDAIKSPPPLRISPKDWGLFIIIALALIFSFTSLRSWTWTRRAFQAGLIGYLGFYNGQILAISLAGGWTANGLPWRAAPGLVLLAAVALLLPWTTRRAVYCTQLCPHGAAQEWLGRIAKKRLHLPAGIESGLRYLPFALIALVLIVIMLRMPLDLARIEPFDAYIIKSAGVATITIAVIGLCAAIFIPMAYCKYACPTGALLAFVRSHGRADTFTRRDIAASVLVLLTIGLERAYFTLRPLIHGAG